ncbi:MAG: hypothetical protein QM692_17670 [Thermomicrobiales bacterium]
MIQSIKDRRRLILSSIALALPGIVTLLDYEAAEGKNCRCRCTGGYKCRCHCSYRTGRCRWKCKAR